MLQQRGATTFLLSFCGASVTVAVFCSGAGYSSAHSETLAMVVTECGIAGKFHDSGPAESHWS